MKSPSLKSTGFARFNLRPLLGVWCFLIALGAGSRISVAAEAPLRVLIMTGQNNHNWAMTTPELKRILVESGRFTVEVTETPERSTAETFSHYDVLLSNWNTFGKNVTVREWPQEMREALLGFVRKGGGFVVVHAGGASFPDWADYQKLIGGTWGPKTGHGTPHAFQVKPAAVENPITQGLTQFETFDELWHRVPIQPDATILATAFSSTDKKGTGMEEPVVWVTRWGQGRCFNTALGHDVRAMQSAGFKTLLVRGTEWAARGTVTHQK